MENRHLYFLDVNIARKYHLQLTQILEQSNKCEFISPDCKLCAFKHRFVSLKGDTN